MIIYEPVEFFKIQREELEELCAAVVDVWPSEISFTDKRFGAFEQYKCGSFTQAYQRAEETFESRLERGDSASGANWRRSSSTSSQERSSTLPCTSSASTLAK